MAAEVRAPEPGRHRACLDDQGHGALGSDAVPSRQRGGGRCTGEVAAATNPPKHRPRGHAGSGQPALQGPHRAELGVAVGQADDDRFGLAALALVEGEPQPAACRRRPRLRLAGVSARTASQDGQRGTGWIVRCVSGATGRSHVQQRSCRRHPCSRQTATCARRQERRKYGRTSLARQAGQYCRTAFGRPHRSWPRRPSRNRSSDKTTFSIRLDCAS